jgi:Clp amino terminal domain, pathogenicity island component
MASQEPYPEPYLATIHRGFMFARELGQRPGPLHLLVGIAEGDGPAAAALASGDGPPLRAVVSEAAAAFGDGAGYLQLQAQEAARDLAAQRGQVPAPGHLLIALLDQGTPEVLRALSLAGLDPAAVRRAAASAIGVPAGLLPLTLPPPVPAGSMDRPALPVDELDERAWAALRWRQDHLPLGRLRGRDDLQALGNLERSAALRVADRLALGDDQRYSLLSRHDAEVTRRVAEARPDLGPSPRRPPLRYRRRRRHRLPWLPAIHGGLAAWLGNRRVSVRDRWFWLRTRASYRGAPQV